MLKQLAKLKVSTYIGVDKTAAFHALKQQIDKDEGVFLAKMLQLINPEMKPSFFVYIMVEYSRLGSGSSFGELALKLN